MYQNDWLQLANNPLQHRAQGTPHSTRLEAQGVMEF
jgi:hypothetical protein